jgi:hypothetical protein
MEEIFIKFHIDANSFHWYETSRLKCAMVQGELTFSWINQAGWVHEVVGGIIKTWLGS